MLQACRQTFRVCCSLTIALSAWVALSSPAVANYAPATMQSDPVDIIMVVDSSASMGAEIASLNAEIEHLVLTLGAASIDYRLIMIGEFGTGSAEICIEAPTGGIPSGGCGGGPNAPINTPTFFHYSTTIGSLDSFCKLLSTYDGTQVDDFGLVLGGWETLLRPDALKVLIFMSDDRTNCSTYQDLNTVLGGQMAALNLDADLLALSPSQFGLSTDRKYVAHSIIAMEANTPASEPWLPTDPITTAECTPGASNPGTGQQALSVLTGGLRFPLCDPSLYDVFFIKIAQDTIARVMDNMPSSCNGDGGDQLGCTDCPCVNNALPGTIGGCLHSGGGSTELTVSGDPSVSLPSGDSTDLRFGLVGAPASAFCILNSGDGVAPNNMANPCFGLGSGAQAAAFDGLRCAVMNTRRHGGRSADGSGEVGVTNNPWGGEGGPPAGIAAAGAGFIAGQTRYFQVIHRDDPLMVCMRGLNTSQAIEVTFTP